MDVFENLKKVPELSHDAVKIIERARQRIKAGKFVAEADAKKKLGI